MSRQVQRLPPRVQRLLAPFFPDFDLDAVRIREGIPWFVISDPAGFTLRNTIYFKPGAYRPDSLAGLALIGHEVAHCVQYRRCGTVRFLTIYLTAYLRNRRGAMSHLEAYWSVPFEEEAREIEDLIRDTLSDEFRE